MTMKYILAFLSLAILASSRGEEVFQEFDEKIKEAYSEYVLEEHYDENYPYGIKLVIGNLGGKIRYGFCFYSDDPNAYYVRVYYKDKLYAVESNSRGDVQAVALDLPEGSTFALLIFDSVHDEEMPLPKFKNLKIMSKTEFEQLENKFQGMSKGAALTRLKPEFKLAPDFWFYMFAVSIILVCGLVIFIFYKRRQGLFNKEIRSQNVFNFREFLSSSFEFPQEATDEYEEAEYEVMEEYEEEEQAEQEPRFGAYPWARYEEEKSGFNIGEYLRDKGYVTDYNFLSESEKNQIMLELMRLKDEKTITHDEYLEEIMKLWKK